MRHQRRFFVVVLIAVVMGNQNVGFAELRNGLSHSFCRRSQLDLAISVWCANKPESKGVCAHKNTLSDIFASGRWHKDGP